MNRAADDSPPPVFAARHDQYLAFIHAYPPVNGRPPAEADMIAVLPRHTRSTGQNHCDEVLGLLTLSGCHHLAYRCAKAIRPS
jgi:hypothetical protein